MRYRASPTEAPPVASVPSQSAAEPVIETQKSSQELPFTPPKWKLVEARFVEEAVVEKKLVVVALVPVAFLKVKFCRVEEPLRSNSSKVTSEVFRTSWFMS